MKINSLYISAFGKFKDFRLDFNNNLNLFYGENENGKSTILAFIKMMFYGNTVKSSDLLKNPRKKYLPFDNSIMAGSIDFTHNGKDFRIERTFGASNSTDRITLIDLLDGTRQNFSGTTDMGAKFFNLSASAFERCAFIASFGPITDDNTATGELNSRLSGIIVSGEEDVNEKKIAARLIAAKEELMSKGGKVGKYDKNRQKLIDLANQLTLSRQAEEDREALALKIENQKKRLVLVNKEIDRTAQKLKATEQSRNWRKLKDFIEISSQFSVAKKKLTKKNGEIIDTESINIVEDKLSMLKLLDQTLPEQKSRLAVINSEIAAASTPAKSEAAELVEQKISQLNGELNNIIERQNDAKETVARLENLRSENLKKHKKISPALLVLCLIFVVLGAISLKYKLAVAIILFAVSVVLFILGLILVKSQKPLNNKETLLLEKSEQEIAFCQEEILRIEAETEEQQNIKNALYEQFKKASSLTQEKLESLEVLKEKIEKGEQEVERIKQFFAEFFENETVIASISGVEIAIHAYRDYIRQYDTAKAKLALLKADLGEDMTAELAAVKLNEIGSGEDENTDPKKLEEYLNFKQKEANEITKSIAYDEAVARTDFSAFRHPTDIEHEIEKTEKLLAEQKEFCESIDIAAKALANAFAKTRKTFSYVLEKRTAEIFSGLTGGNYSNVSVSKEFSLAVESSNFFGSRGWQYLSAGTIDQAYFALRLALSELLSKDCGGLPIFIDDAFCQYDDTRSQKAMEFLKEYSKNAQVIFFTCRKSSYQNKNEFKPF